MESVHPLSNVFCAGYLTAIFNIATLAGLCLEIVCDSEGDEGVGYCEESLVCIFQGILIFLMGASTLFDLGIEFVCRHATPMQRSQRKAFVSIALQPLCWMLLAFTAVSSKSYYCNAMPCAAKHYLYPIMIILQNPDMWRALLVFGSAMGSALAVLFTFWCSLLGLSAVAMILLQGEFQTKDFMTGFLQPL